MYVSYAPEDRMWADWIEAVLTRANFRVIPRSTVSAALSGADASTQSEHEVQSSARAIAIGAKIVWLATSALRAPPSDDGRAAIPGPPPS